MVVLILRVKKFYKKTIESAEDLPFLKHLKFFSNIKLLVLATNEKNFMEARRYLDSAENHINIADTLRSNYYLNLYSSLLYNAQKKNDSAYAMLMNAYLQDFQLDFRKNTLEINRMNVELETQEKENDNLKLKQNKIWLITALSLTILFLLLSYFAYKHQRSKKKIAERDKEIEQQKVEKLLKDQELNGIDAMIEGQEKERQRVANELHDDLGSLMATIKLHFENIKADKEDPALKSTHNLLDMAYNKIRGMAHAKNSGVIASQGLLPAVKKMAKTISNSNTIKIDIHDYGLDERMENSLELSIFRILQELITNILKHAGATKASIQFTQSAKNLNIIVEDNGKGFDTYFINHTKNGIGLNNIEKRIEHLEGNFTIDSVLGKGTSIIIDIPL